MAKYKDIGGTTVGFKSGAEEYTYPSGAEGSIYYNSSNGQFEFVGTATGAWSTGGTMNTGRTSSTGTGSSSSDHIIAGGYYLPPSVDRSATETYNGTSWTEVADCPADLTYGNGLGSSTASLLCGYARPGPAPGGFGPTTDSHLWNGSAWSSGGTMINGMYYNTGAGTVNDAASIGGYNGATIKIDKTPNVTISNIDNCFIYDILIFFL